MNPLYSDIPNALFCVCELTNYLLNGTVDNSRRTSVCSKLCRLFTYLIYLYMFSPSVKYFNFLGLFVLGMRLDKIIAQLYLILKLVTESVYLFRRIAKEMELIRSRFELAIFNICTKQIQYKRYIK